MENELPEYKMVDPRLYDAAQFKDYAAVHIMSGPYKGLVYIMDTVDTEEQEDGGLLVDINYIPLRTPEGFGNYKETQELKDTIGRIFMRILENHIDEEGEFDGI